MGIIFTGSRHSIRPSLNLDFANSKALDPRITFTRASNATYYDGYTSVKAEENLLPYSQEIDNAAWSKFNTTVTANTETAPDGTTTADTLTANGGTNPFDMIDSSGTKESTVTVSAFLKQKGTQQYVFLGITYGFNNTWVASIVDLTNGTITSDQSGADATHNNSTITDAGNGWYRVSVTGTNNTTVGSNTLRIGFVPSGTSTISSYARHTYTTSGTVETYFWGGQLEVRDSVTAYTATSGTPITKYQPALQTAGNNVARFDHNPTTGESLGLLIEESRTNLVTRSEEFDNAYWSKTNYTAKANQTLAPDGTLSADLLILDDGVLAGVTKSIARGTFTTSGTSAFSIYIKNFGCTGTFYLQDGAGNGVAFNLENNTKSNFGLNLISSPVAEDVGNGWYRLKFATSTTINSFYMYQSGFTGNGHNGVFLWGAQFEAAKFPTSYIKTTGSQVTRSNEEAVIDNIDTSDWYKQGVGTWFADFKMIQDFQNVSTGNDANVILNLNDNSSNVNRFDIYVNSSIIQNHLRLLNVNYTSILTSSNSFGGKVASKFENGNHLLSFNGTTSTPNTSFSFIPIFTQLKIGRGSNITAFLDGRIKKLSYYPIALTDNEITDLSEE